MGLRDIKILAATLAGVLILVLFTILAPVYRMPNGGYEHHWVWNAPSMPVGHGYDSVKPEDIKRLSADPQQKKILDGMRDMPRSIPISPIYLGSRWGPGRNTLGYLTMMSIIGWCVLFGYKWANR